MPSLDYDLQRRTLRAALKEEGAPSIREIARRTGRHHVYLHRVLSGNDVSQPVLDQIEAEIIGAQPRAKTAA